MPWYFGVAYFVIIFGVISGGFRYSRLNNSSKILYLLLVATLFSEVLALVFSKVIKNNLIIYRVFAVVQIVFITCAYFVELVRYKRLFIGSVFIYFLVYLFELVKDFKYISSLYPTIVKSYGSTLIVTYSLLYTYELLVAKNNKSYLNYPLFWVSGGLMVFSIITLLNFSLFNSIAVDKNLYKLFEYTRIGANIMLYFTFCLSFFTKQYQL
ncbi:hypothetical protein [Tellurirhabdus rosea]|uniref:hypothetical protein n=1 Tax=Tellurirhabdus rosea TaxID=2674997 RepID=UPI0022508F40|nr:hypothetical protein [Tellurirhabdus rosea]